MVSRIRAGFILSVFCLQVPAFAATIVLDDDFPGSGGIPPGWTFHSVLGPPPTIGHGSSLLTFSITGTASFGHLQSDTAFPTGTELTVTGRNWGLSGSSAAIGFGLGDYATARVGVAVNVNGVIYIDTRKSGTNNSYMVGPYGGGSILTATSNASGIRVTTNTGFDSGVLPWATVSPVAGFQFSDLGPSTIATIPYALLDTGFIYLDRITVSLSTPDAVDDGPIAATEGVHRIIPVGANDTGFTNPVSVTVTTPPAKGTVTNVSPPGPAAGMTVTYLANIGASGADSFVYSMTDSLANSDSATVNLTIGPPAPSLTIVSNLNETYNFGAGLGGVFVEASSFTNGPAAYRLDSLTLDLQVNSATSVSASLYSDSGSLPGTLLRNLGTQAVQPGEHDVVFTPSGFPFVLLPGTKYWVVVEQVAGGDAQWVSTYSTAEASSVGATIGNAMYYRNVSSSTWTAQPTATDTGQFAVQGTLTSDGDADGVYDAGDNCSLKPNPIQCDSDGDGYGNHCDGDMNNNGTTNAQDTTLFRQQLGQPSVAPTYNKADINCNGAVNSQDNTLYRQLIGSPPGPHWAP